jgi:hypothetical protein
MAVNASTAAVKTVADANASYESLRPLWVKSRAACRGERFVKDYDRILSSTMGGNLLIPFSPSMTQDQYDFFRAEAEWPGITSQFAKMLVGGLLRKQPTLNLPDSMDKTIKEEAQKWIINDFGKDDSPLTSFMDEALWEEVQTSRAWIFVDYPQTAPDMLPEEAKKIKPYPVLHMAEAIVNWKTSTDATGKTVLERVHVRGYSEEYDNDQYEFHPRLVETVWVHELIEGCYQVRIYKVKADAVEVPVQNGDKQIDVDNSAVFELEDTIPVLYNGEPLDTIPAWPLNGNIEAGEPLLTAIVDKEVSLYNKLSRRNHLLYGAATYTPVIIDSELTDAQFEDIVESGLGTWIHLKGPQAKAEALKTPTEALKDFDLAIKATIEEMAKLGIRMLTPETDQSGVALEIRNAAQTAQLGSLNNKICNTMKQIIAFMINWRYDLELTAGDIDFCLSTDFNPMPVGDEWLRLATEWYQAGLIPRSAWLSLLKHNEMLAPDYDDEEGQKEINEDEFVVPKTKELDMKFGQDMENELKNPKPSGKE